METKKKNKSKDMRKPSWFVYYILGPFIILFARIKFGIRTSGDKPRKNHATLVIGPHRSYYDIFYAPISIYPRRAHFVSTSVWFRSKALSILLNWMKTIPKDQYRSDLKSILRIGEYIKAGHDIIIFPEGQMSIDSKSLFLPKGLDRLISKFKPDVMYINTSGSYLISPKWAKKIARGHVYCERQLIIKSEEIDQIGLDGINERINNAFRQSSDLEWIKNRKSERYFSKSKALGMDTVIMECPKCQRHLPFKSEGNTLSCECGLKLTFKNENYDIMPNELGIENLSSLLERDYRTFEEKIRNGLVLENKAHFTCYTDIEEIPMFDGILRMDNKTIDIINPKNIEESVHVEIEKTINLVVALGKRLEIPTPDKTIKCVIENPKEVVVYWNYMNYLKRLEQ